MFGGARTLLRLRTLKYHGASATPFHALVPARGLPPYPAVSIGHLTMLIVDFLLGLDLERMSS